ncbi:MAG: glycosyltransferase family 4 protein [Spirochaetes bacterium]|nr:glycosyltransferase family 4 protein [Spirochaetota bacterium]
MPDNDNRLVTMPKKIKESSHRSAAAGRDRAGSIRIALFSPMEPLKSGVAWYSLKIIQGLVKKRPGVAIDVYIDDGYAPDEIVSDAVRLLNHRLFHENRDLYHAVLYEVGNNYEFHSYMLPYIHACGGIVEFHDVNTSGIYAKIIKDLAGHLKKLRLLRFITTVAVYPELRFFLWYKLIRPFREKNAFLDRHLYRKSMMVRKAAMVIVHDDFMRNHFRLPARKTRIITHGIDIRKLPSESEKAAIRRRMKIGKSAFVLVSAGLINSIKKIDRVIEAVARLKAETPDLLYVLAGQSVLGEHYIESLIEKFGLESRVRITGWLSNEDWLDYLSIADVGVNLRSENLGEHSGPTISFIEKGKVILVSDFEQYRAFPDEFAIKIPNGEDDVRLIAEKVLWLYNNRDFLKRGGRIAREYAITKLDFDERIIPLYCDAMRIPERF